MPVVQPDRERVVADPTVEPRVELSEDAARPRRAHQVAAVEHGYPVEAGLPLHSLLGPDEEDRRDAVVEPSPETVEDARVEEDPDRELIRERDPDPPPGHDTRA